MLQKKNIAEIAYTVELQKLQAYRIDFFLEFQIIFFSCQLTTDW